METIEIPVAEVELIVSISAISCSTVSISVVTRVSTRAGAAPGKLVVTVANRLVMVGSS
jgi:hypothetical protein